jgi:hypothetical protein
MAAHASTTADAASRGIRLTIPIRVGERMDAIDLEPPHLEWLARVASYIAVRDGLAGMPEALTASFVPGVVRERHGDVLCLESFAVALRDARGRQVARVGFPREVLEPFVTARAVHRVLESAAAGTHGYASSLHATAGGEPLPVVVPALPHLSVAALATGAVAEGAPARRWIATFVHPAVVEDFDRLDATSRARGVEMAARIHTRVGFDRETRTFVRILERLVVTRDAAATGTTVVSTGGSWGEFLAAAPGEGVWAHSHVHSHLHLGGGDAAAGEETEGPLDPTAKPMISTSDRVSHLTVFCDPLAAATILSLYPERRVTTVYGYRSDGRLAEEPGYWVLPEHPTTTRRSTT